MFAGNKKKNTSNGAHMPLYNIKDKMIRASTARRTVYCVFIMAAGMLVPSNTAGLNDPCNIDTDCSINMINSVCINQKCGCGTGFHIVGGSCSVIAIGEQCSSDADCQTHVHHSACTNSRCTCATGYKISTTGCAANVLGNVCAQNQDCVAAIAHSVCRNHKCTCQDGYVHDRNSCNTAGGGVMYSSVVLFTGIIAASILAR